ncbi:NaeI domain-containing protein [Paraburkholderia unamae]|uniref:NaeI family type II restriction endonuclease n=1 Tax=Paraburkholderia unamae TaxID=219649 RepID=UPI001CAC1947|nr:NaeI family type II restriction endonuclease [Paraburkholderia unamae]CAG9273437.1 NaeI domain-containing protein [Paraburkholderia unamae]
MTRNQDVDTDSAEVFNEEIEVPVSADPPPPASEIAIRMARIREDLVGRVGEQSKFVKEVGQLIRDAIDYVIDAPVLYRYSIFDLDPDEKTAIGKRIERLLRFRLKIRTRKKLDVFLGGEDVDIKTTMKDKWMFSKSNFDHICLLIKYDEAAAKYSLGLALVLEKYLGKGNRDTKKASKAEFREYISWVLRDEPYPENFVAHLPESHLSEILEGKSGAERVRRLLQTESVIGRAIPRHAVCSVANQLDPLRRTRQNGGARDELWRDGYLILSGRTPLDAAIAREISQVSLKKDELMSLRARDVTLKHRGEYKAAHRIA